MQHGSHHISARSVLGKIASSGRPRSGKSVWRRVGAFACFAVIAVLVIAWIDGGEEPIHPISQSVPLPVSVTGAAPAAGDAS